MGPATDKVHPACHNIVNGIKPGSDSRKTDKHAVDWLGRKVIYVRCINCCVILQ